jgi:hypothetical protein
MSDSETTKLLRRRRVTEFRQRGPIYNWLRAHYAAICALMASGEGTWPRLCREMQRHGVVARGGAAPSEKAASKAWQTVCRDLADTVPAAPKRPGSIYPSRIPKDWKPQVVPPPAVEPAPRGQLTPGIHPPDSSLIRKPSSENAVTGRKLTGKEKLARLELELASRRGG